MTTVCPYCFVEYGIIVYYKGGKLINIERNPNYPVNNSIIKEFLL
uniref:4Fe-4S Mo/W bis-MGD-type domain-containing protein n=1 Tax=Thermodesulfobacterium geofontis TaxID=1295609 RepID=A0A7V6CDW5_9BACT